MTSTWLIGLCFLLLAAVGLLVWWQWRSKATIDALQQEVASMREALATAREAVDKVAHLAPQFRALEQTVRGLQTTSSDRLKELSSETKKRTQALEEGLALLDEKVGQLSSHAVLAAQAGAERIAWPGWLGLSEADSKTEPMAFEKVVRAARTEELQGWLADFHEDTLQWTSPGCDVARLAGGLREASKKLLSLLRSADASEQEAVYAAEWLFDALKPRWASVSSGVHTRGCTPGMPFDPDWMEPAGGKLASHVVASCVAFAIFERSGETRQLILKTQVLTE